MTVQTAPSSVVPPREGTTPMPGRRLSPGDVVPDVELDTIAGEAIRLRQPGRHVHLQLRRFAGCPVCNLHLRSVVARYEELWAASVVEVVVFHSTAEELRRYQDGLPFALVADPDKQLYAAFGAEASPRALPHPRAWGPILRAVLRSALLVLRGETRLPPIFPGGGRTGLPADLLIDEDGRVVAARYGEHVYDQLSVDEVLAAASVRGGVA